MNNTQQYKSPTPYVPPSNIFNHQRPFNPGSTQPAQLQKNLKYFETSSPAVQNITQLQEELLHLKGAQKDSLYIDTQIINLQENLHQLTQENQQIVQKNGRLNETKDSMLMQLRDEIENQKSILSQNKQRNCDLFIQLNHSKQDSGNQFKAEMQQAHQDILSFQSQTQELVQQKQQYMDEVNRMQDENMNQSQEMQEVQRENEEKSNYLNQCQQQLSSESQLFDENACSFEQLNQNLQKLDNDIGSKMAEIQDLQNEENTLLNHVETFNNTIEQSKQNDINYVDDNNQLQVQIDQQSENNQVLCNVINDTITKIKASQTSVKALKNEIQVLEQQVSSCSENNELHQTKVTQLRENVNLGEILNEQLVKDIQSRKEAEEALLNALKQRAELVQNLRNKQIQSRQLQNDTLKQSKEYTDLSGKVMNALATKSRGQSQSRAADKENKHQYMSVTSHTQKDKKNTTNSTNQNYNNKHFEQTQPVLNNQMSGFEFREMQLDQKNRTTTEPDMTFSSFHQQELGKSQNQYLQKFGKRAPVNNEHNDSTHSISEGELNDCMY